MNQTEQAALERLIRISQSNTGQSRRVASFLLAWWSATSCGGFDLTDLWAVDAAIAADMVTVFGLIANNQNYPDVLGYADEFKPILQVWRPELL